MTAMAVKSLSLTLPTDRPMTRADLDALPDDLGLRYELVDGVLLVSAAPRPRHQLAAFRLAMLLEQARTPDLWVLPAPVDVALDDDTVLEPDIVVAPVSDFSEKDLPTAPLLAVEVLSPSTRSRDIGIKKDRLARAGCASYWVVDPEAPALVAWELRGGQYVMVARASGDEVFETAFPIPMSVRPSDLVRA